MFRWATGLAILFVALLAFPVDAGSCRIGNSTPDPLSPGPHGETGITMAGFYVFKDPAPIDICPGDENSCFRVNAVGTWVYQETNRIAGLQRDDHYVDDTCRGWVLPDTPIF